MPCTVLDIAKRIDHALLQPTLTVEELEHGICLARQFDVASVCVLPYYLRRCSELLQGSDVLPSTVIGFPHGSNTTYVKVAEAQRAMDDGAAELDMVVNVSKVLSGDWGYVRDEIRAIVENTHGRGRRVKVIFENCYLRDEHKVRLCEICGELQVELGQDLNRFWHGRRHRGGRVVDARPLPTIRAGEGVRGHSHSGYGVGLL